MKKVSVFYILIIIMFILSRLTCCFASDLYLVQEQEKKFTEEEKQVLKKTKVIRLIVKVSTWREGEARYDFEKAIKQRLTKKGFEVVPEDTSEYDATLFADCEEARGSYFSGPPGSLSNALGCRIRLEHKRFGLVFEKTFWNTAPWPYLWSNSYEAGVKNLEEGELHFKYLGDIILAKLGREDEVVIMIKALQDKAWTIRMEAAGILRGLKDPRGVEPLIATLSDSRPDVVESAIYALECFGDKRAVKPLIDVLQKNPWSHVRGRAAYALGKIGDKKAIEALQEAITNECEYVRAYAQKALKMIQKGEEKY
ncbi:MAG: HEAT repeat domain-containing protein [Candidatus Aminicenantes bacterium]|nr:MAG: HEAT repeat domain-containing protein [Candidatus Aminicenantes bacterium]